MQRMFFYKITFAVKDATDMSVEQWDREFTGAVQKGPNEVAFFSGRDCIFYSDKFFKVGTLNDALATKFINYRYEQDYEGTDDWESYGAAFIYDVPDEKDGQAQILISEAKRRIHLESIKEYLKRIQSLRNELDKCVEKAMKLSY